MSSAPQVASTYARAILEAAGTNVALVRDELAQLADVAANQPEIWSSLTDPTISEADRMTVINKLFADGHPLTRNTLAVLSKMGRLEDLPEIVTALTQLVQAQSGELEVTVTTAVEIPAELKATIEQRLSKSTGSKVQLHSSVDPAIIGGLVVRHGDTLIDGSVRSRIDHMRTTLSRPPANS